MSGELGVGALVAIIGAVVCCGCSCAVLMFARYKLGQGHAEEETKEDNALVNLRWTRSDVPFEFEPRGARVGGWGAKSEDACEF